MSQIVLVNIRVDAATDDNDDSARGGLTGCFEIDVPLNSADNTTGYCEGDSALYAIDVVLAAAQKALGPRVKVRWVAEDARV